MFHQGKGRFAPQAHVGIPEGTYEDEHGRQGFFGRTTHLYHSHPPTNWESIDGPCKPQAFNMYKLPLEKDHWQPTFLLENRDVRIGFSQPTTEMPYYFRNGDGDDVYFIHEGGGVLESDFGVLTYERGDYLVIPKGTTFRFKPASGNQKYLVIESRGEINLPDKGLLGRHALFDPAMLQTPELPAKPLASPAGTKNEKYTLVIKRENKLTHVTYGFNPLDVVGWKGDLSIVKINIKEFRPVISHRYHLAPSVHSTFVAKGHVICSFVPRPFEQDPEANRVPFYHRNIDYDEVIFYHDGDFFSRKNMGAGMVTFHPFGIHHGPHPGAAEAAKKKEMTNEYAVMVDTRDPLTPTAAARQCEWADYHMSWK